MGYYDVLKWLVNRRIQTEEFNTIKQVAKELKVPYDQAWAFVIKLERDGYAEGKAQGNMLREWSRGYRATQKALKEYKS